MPVKTFVGCVADFPSERNEHVPAGRELAEFLTHRLVENGFASEPPNSDGGWAWQFDTFESDRRILTTVGLVGDFESEPPRQWLIANELGVRIFKRLWGGKSYSDKNEIFLKRLCENIHEIISSDARFSHVVWYDRDTLDKPNDLPAKRP